jgi:hypothetical protein
MTDIIRIPNIENYMMTVINGELVLTLIRKYLKKEELFRIDLSKSKILFCTIKEIINMIVMNTYSLDIRFKLETGEIVNYQQ